MTPSRESEGVKIVAAYGEVDLSTAHELDAAVFEAVSRTGEGGWLILDLTGVVFMDVTGLNLLIRARSAVREAQAHLGLVCSQQVEYLLRVAGLDGHFDLYPDLDSAVRGDPGR